MQNKGIFMADGRSDTSTEHDLKIRYYHDRTFVIKALDAAIQDPSEKDIIDRFWWYRAEDEEVKRERKMRMKMAENAA